MRELNFKGNTPILYIIATPIGNLNEMTPRAIETIRSMDYIACEDTRVSGKLLAHFEIQKPLVSCREHNEISGAIRIINDLKSGLKVAYLSDAGYPSISDPGNRLIREALSSGIKVSVISGANAMLNALVGSGLNSERFYFHGFLSPKEKARIDELRGLIKRRETLIFYEAPHRILKTLSDMVKIFGNRKACLARELTKKHEEFIRMNLSDLAMLDKDSLKGEMVLVVEGNNEEIAPHINDDEVRKMVSSFIDIGMTPKDAIKQVSDLLKIAKNQVYKIFHQN
ncbi:MAG: 16S rRNA (cytidine(1402)-2'-O)-methyltransferase [Bacilli bacterium]|jgi:16S rRNA (cytidine1402-2'-O)-methyltransferase|nr:16S rRNA (cytidine(1402)-2'-O)-methyltransferase [Bacilli bacterium]MDD4006290.1 16S rRNA (cytidine(1402)-2'-O)-methyltransferase [Bacilli bacterium]